MTLRHGRCFSISVNLMALSSIFLSLSISTLDFDIGIGIGIGVGDPPPSPDPECGCPVPPPPPAPQFENEKLRRAYHVIHNFKKTITCDPKGITGSWSGTDPCKYAGFYCSSRAPDDPHNLRTIASVDFNGYNLAAPTIAGFIDGLPDVALFHANSNSFAGAVPDLTHLAHLYELDLSSNNLGGSFPSAVLPLKNLTFLDLRFNRFAGGIPPEVFDLGADVVFLNNNGFVGHLPASVGGSTALYLTLANNGLTGPIPASIGEAAGTLREVLLLNNRLSGCLPSDIGKLRHARVIDAGGNGITGRIPESFGCLTSAEQLNFAGNMLYGEVPEALCRLTKVENISLSGNYLTGMGRSCWRLVKTGVLDVRGNCIDGCEGQRPGFECQRFLARAESCPATADVPCCLPRKDEKSTGAGAGAGKDVSAREGSKYRAYSALVGHRAL